MPSIKAAIFDFDGLMVDTERFSFRIFQRIAAEYGRSLADEHLPHLIGLDQTQTADYILAATGIPLSADALNELYLRYFDENMAELTANPGLYELLAELERRGMPLGIASNSPTEFLERMLAQLRVREAFQVLVGREQVLEGKPAPDLYLRAAALLGVAPSACLAVEDSPVGMQSAIAAGMRVAGVNEEEVFGARARFRSLEELRERLEEVFKDKG
jgi:beta-phosphoglucomutase